MNKQNVTLSLPKSLLKKAKLIATSQDKSLSALLTEALRERVQGETGYAHAKARQIRLLETGLDFGAEGKVAAIRAELHERE